MRVTLWFDVFSLGQSCDGQPHHFAAIQQQFLGQLVEHRVLAGCECDVSAYGFHLSDAIRANKHTIAPFVCLTSMANCIAQSLNSGSAYAR